MIPSLEPGCHVLLRPVQASRVRPGDIVVAGLGEDHLVVHRALVVLPGGGVRTQGDNRPVPDADWKAEHVRARVVARWDAATGRWLRQRRKAGRLMALAAGLPSRRLVRLVQIVLVRMIWEPMPATGSAPMPGPARAAQILRAGDAEVFEIQRLGNEWAVHDTRSGAVHMLNRTAYDIWSLARSGLDTPGVVGELSSRYPEVDKIQLAQDTAQVMETLRTLDLV